MWYASRPCTLLPNCDSILGPRIIEPRPVGLIDSDSKLLCRNFACHVNYVGDVRKAAEVSARVVCCGCIAVCSFMRMVLPQDCRILPDSISLTCLLVRYLVFPHPERVLAFSPYCVFKVTFCYCKCIQKFSTSVCSRIHAKVTLPSQSSQLAFLC
jgi:hypothetical protein